MQKRHIDSYVCYGRGRNVNRPGVYRVGSELYSNAWHAMSIVTGYEYAGCHHATKMLCKYIDRIKPDVIHIHCLNGYFVNIYKLLFFLKEHRIPTVLTLHAEFMYTGGCGYAKRCEKYMTGCGRCPQFRDEKKSLFFDKSAKCFQKMADAFSKFDTLHVVSVSPWLMNRAQYSPILRSMPHSTILNGVDTAVFHPTVSKGTDEGKKVLYVTGDFYNSIKGGQYVLSLAHMNPQIRFVIAGSDLSGMSLPENVKSVGRISDQHELARLYSLADVTLITSQYETFSMPVAESLCCGTPVVGFRAGAPETITIERYSIFVEQGDIEALNKAMHIILATSFDSLRIAKEAAEKYRAERMGSEYVELYRQLSSGERYDNTNG